MTATETSAARAGFEAAWSATQKSVRGREPSWLVQERENAWALFSERGFPARDDDDWKYTNVAPIAKSAFAAIPRAPELKAGEAPPQLDGAIRVVLVNGKLAPALSETAKLPHGVYIDALSAILARSPETLRAQLGRPRNVVNAFSALNAAIFEDGVHIRVDGKTRIERPIHLVHVTAGGASFAIHPRVIVELGAGCEVDLVESFVGATGVGAALTNVVQDFHLDEGAVLHHARIVDDSAHAMHIGMTRATLGKDARYASVALTFGGALVRHDLHVSLDAPGASCALDGLYRLSGSQHADNHTTIDHVAPHCTSTELYRGIVDDKSRGVFFGRIIVRHGAQKTSSEQQNNNLVLSNDALVDSTPQLEIFADDVQCRHGSTIGQIDPDQLFYLRSRGLSAESSRSLLMFAFANEVLEKIHVPALRETFARRIAGSEGALT